MLEQFHRPRTPAQALRLKKKYKRKALYLSGGTCVNSALYPKNFTHVISLDSLKLDFLQRKNGITTIGAGCTLQQILESKNSPQAVKEALLRFTNRNIRNIATLGGVVASRLSCSDLLPVLLALDAQLVFAGSVKKIPLEEYALSRQHNRDKLLTKIILPKPEHKRRVVSIAFRESSIARSLLVLALAVTLDAKGVKNPLIFLGGAGQRLSRLKSVEKMLEGKPLPDTDALQKMVEDNLVLKTCLNTCLIPCPSAENLPGEAFRKHQVIAMLRSLVDTLKAGGL